MTALRIIIISAGLWRSCVDVQVDPPRADVPLRTFADHAKARAHAEALHEAHGWAVVDECQPRQREA